MKKTVSLIAIFTLFLAHTYAQLKMPQASSSQSVVQEFGLGSVTVKYSRPNVKGRKVFTELAPYGEVWRTGANSATVITFSEDLTLDGHPVKAGEYGLFTIPGKDTWTIILNKGSQQWGAYQYKTSDDVLRFQAKALQTTDHTETFTISFSEVMPAAAKLNLLWDHTRVSIRMSTDVDSKVMATIEEAMKSDKKPYFEAAQYYYENGKDLVKALEWVTAAETADPKAPWYKYWKARIQLKAGDKAGAIASAKAGIEAAKLMNIAEYVRLNNAVISQASK